MKKVMYISAAITAVLILSLFIGIQIIKNRGVPDYNQDIRLKGLSDKVQVYRDKYGVPSIYASTQRDLYYATGYVMAQDRMWQMDLMRRVTMGRISEIFGEKLVDADELFRTLRITDNSRAIVSTLKENEKENLQLFCDGINQYIEDNKDDLPLEFLLLGYTPEKWEPVHSLNLIGFMSWNLTMSWRTEIVAQKVIDKTGFDKYSHLLPDPQKTNSHVYHYTDTLQKGPETAFLDRETHSKMEKALRFIEDNGLNVFQASNNWVVSGSRTESGKPLFANDMHLGLNSPGIWYQIHQHAPGLHVLGVALPGSPVVIAGHNERIAWGMTNVVIDNADFYLEKVKKDGNGNPVRYMYNGSWHDISTRIMEIGVKGKEKPVIRTMYLTRNGAIISKLKKVEGRAVSMRWAGNEPSNEFRGAYMLNTAANWSDFTRAVANFKSVSQNIAYADVEGNIGMYASAGIPIRSRKPGTFFYDGWNDKYQWKGYVPFEQQPHEKNPRSGVLASANNKSVADSYPHYISIWYYPANRFNRIVQELTGSSRHTVEGFRKLQMDMVSLLPQKFVPGILEAIDSFKSTEKYRKDRGLKETLDQMYGKLKDWNGFMGVDSREAAVFEVFYNRFLRNTLQDELGPELYQEFVESPAATYSAVEQLWKDPSNTWFDNIQTEKRETRNDIIISTLLTMAEEGMDMENIGEWGDLHTLTLKHPMGSKKILDILFGLNSKTYAVGGSFHTVCPYTYTLDKDYNAHQGASQRHIFDLADWDNSLVVLPTGQSGIAGSPHYLDQTEDYVSGVYHPAWFSKKQVMKNAAYKMEFVPYK